MPDRHGVLQALRELPLDEQHKVLEELLSLKPLGAALEAWCLARTLEDVFTTFSMHLCSRRLSCELYH